MTDASPRLLTPHPVPLTNHSHHTLISHHSLYLGPDRLGQLGVVGGEAEQVEQLGVQILNHPHGRQPVQHLGQRGLGGCLDTNMIQL